ncbi:Integrase catalytic domain-containing protein [Citrus sinensis]|nr:Integrase catalytic domain-containing protein [Citrus sinensis]
MEEGNSLANHIDNFNTIILDLEDINVKLEDEDKAIILLSSLPLSYEHFVDTLLYGRQLITMADVKDSLSSKEVTKKAETKDGEGHLKRGYPDKKNKSKEGRGKKVDAAVASEDEGYDSTGVLLASETQTNSTLDQLACSIKMESDVMKVIRGSIVVMKGNMHNSLYVLQGTAVTGDVSVSSNLGLDKTLMWHLRLGHMSEKGLRVLEKQGVFGDDKLGSLEFYEVCVLGKAANYLGLKIFGCAAYAHVKQGKLEPRALKCVFLGYLKGVKGYKLWCTDLKPSRCINSRDVVFNELEMLSKRHATELGDSEEETEDVSESSGGQTEIQDYQLVRDRQRREIKASKRYVYAHLIAYALTAAYELENDEPRTYKEAVSGRDSERWIKAMKEEIKSLYKNNNWKLVKKPDNRKVVGCKWIYKIKPGIPRVEPERSKAKLFAKGYTQKEGIDFIEVFSHVVVRTTVPITEADKSKMMKVPYAGVVGCLMYAMVLTRLGIAYAVNVVSRYMTNLRKEHWKDVKWILRYLRGTSGYRLMYGGQRTDDSLIVGYVDANYAGDLDKRRFFTGYLFTFDNCTINSKAQLQSVVALSTTEAEYTTIEAIKEAIWLKGMLKELGVEQKSMVIHCDSQSAICLSKNQTHLERTKHIDIKLHFIRLEVSKATVKLQKIHTDNNVADMLTKAIPGAKFMFCLNLSSIYSR